MAVDSTGMSWGEGGGDSRSQPSQTNTSQHLRAGGYSLPDQTRATVQAGLGQDAAVSDAHPQRPKSAACAVLPLQPSPAAQLVILNSVPADELSQQQVSALEEYLPKSLRNICN